MKLNSLRTMFVLTAVSVGSAMAATPTLGVASSVGTFTVNSATVNGNANLFDGSKLTTDRAPSQVFLQNGSKLSLSTNSSGTFYNDRFSLEQGAAEVDQLGKYSIDAAGYRVEGDQPNTGARVRFEGKTLEVAALTGTVRVFNSEGALLTRVGAGTQTSFKQSGAGTGTGAGGNHTAILYGVIAAAVVGAIAGGTVAANNNSSGSGSSTSP